MEKEGDRARDRSYPRGVGDVEVKDLGQRLSVVVV